MQCTLSTLSNYLIQGFELLTQFLPLLHDQHRDQVQCVTTSNQDGFSRRSWPCQPFDKRKNAPKLIISSKFINLRLVLANSQQKFHFPQQHLIKKKTGKPVNDERKLPFVQLGRKKNCSNSRCEI